MAAKPLTNETIAVTEMKMEMTLDEIIKLSKKDPPNKKNAHRFSNKNRKASKDSSYQWNSYKAQGFLESRSSIRQGVLANRRTNFPKNQFRITTEVARKGAAAPPRNGGAGNWNRMRKPSFQVKAAEGDVSAAGKNKLVPKQRQTLDARFASIAIQRKKALPPQSLPLWDGPRDRDEKRQQLQQPRRGRNSGFPVAPARRFTNFRR